MQEVLVALPTLLVLLTLTNPQLLDEVEHDSENYHDRGLDNLTPRLAFLGDFTKTHTKTFFCNFILTVTFG